MSDCSHNGSLWALRCRRRTALALAGGILLASASDDRSVNARPRYPGNGKPPLVVDASWLGAFPASEPLVLLDLQPLRHYRQRHLPGAIHAWWQDTMELNNVVYGTLLMEIDDQRQRRDLLTSWGISPDAQVVAYDDEGGRRAARIVWFLRFLGHDRAAMIDGGLSAWVAAGQPTDVASHQAREVETVQVAPRDGYYLVTPQLLDRLQDPRSLLVDCRSEDERLDTVDATLPQGQIPESVWFPWDATLQPSGLLRSADELQALATSAGITPDRSLILYARFGVETALAWLVFSLLGYPNVIVYDRGWAGWSSQPELPTEPIP